jgi:membrane protease YdiL (CAAX protease family)
MFGLLELIGFGVAGMAVLGGTQTLALLAVKDPRPFAWPFRHESESEVVRWSMKGALQIVLLAFLVVFPWVNGDSPLDYLAARVSPAQWLLLGRTMAMTLLVFSTLLLINIRCGWVCLRRHYRPAVAAKKVARGCLTPLPLAFMEEAVFRGILLEQLLRVLPDDAAGQGVAVGISALVFSAVHFLRPQKRTLLPGIGLYALGWTLGLAYLVGGHTIWLPVAIHAGGVLFIQVFRPFVEYRGPAWLVGYRSYPICGILGLTAMAILTVWVTV